MSLPPERRAAFLARAQWLIKARPPQITPQGDWRIWLGEVTRNGGQYQAELRGLHDLMQRPVGDRFTPGCDKRLSTCIGVYNNVENFGGFPYLPGIDKILDYPNSRSG